MVHRVLAAMSVAAATALAGCGSGGGAPTDPPPSPPPSPHATGEVVTAGRQGEGDVGVACDGHGHRFYVPLYNPTQVTVVTDPECGR